MTAPGYQTIIDASASDRDGLFLDAAAQIGTPFENVEKDFWVCWTLDQLFQGRSEDSHRLLFKGGTSLSKGFGLIQRFSEDIDITVFREDLGHGESLDEFEGFGINERKRRLASIHARCSAYITGELLRDLQRAVNEATHGTGRVEVDPDDPDNQTLLLHYPTTRGMDTSGIERQVIIEAGARSALEPNRPRRITPYAARAAETLDLVVDGVTTIAPERTFWDKVIILDDHRRRFDDAKELRRHGNRASRHYYDLHCLMESAVGSQALADDALAVDCVRHAALFFSRPGIDVSAARLGNVRLSPTGDMTNLMERDYEKTKGMIFGEAPDFERILLSITTIEETINSAQRDITSSGGADPIDERVTVAAAFDLGL